MIITVWVYTGIVLLSGLLMLIGIISGSTENMYEFARYFMGMAQSPLILMILFPLFKLAEKENLYKQQ
jgi:fumarate reductase subunit D